MGRFHKMADWQKDNEGAWLCVFTGIPFYCGELFNFRFIAVMRAAGKYPLTVLQPRYDHAWPVRVPVLLHRVRD